MQRSMGLSEVPLITRRAFVGLAAAGLGALGGCSGDRTPPAPLLMAGSELNPEQVAGHIEVWSWNIAAKSLQKLTPAFERHYPRVRVNVDMTGANMQARLLLSLASNVGAPDVSQLQLYETP